MAWTPAEPLRPQCCAPCRVCLPTLHRAARAMRPVDSRVRCPLSRRPGGNIPLITTGGGYSNKNLRPDWQNNTHNMRGRGIPDISVAGHGYAIVIGGRWLTVDGTSASAPVVAGIVSLMNAQLIAAGDARGDLCACVVVMFRQASTLR